MYQQKRQSQAIVACSFHWTTRRLYTRTVLAASSSAAATASKVLELVPKTADHPLQPSALACPPKIRSFGARRDAQPSPAQPEHCKGRKVTGISIRTPSTVIKSSCPLACSLNIARNSHSGRLRHWGYKRTTPRSSQGKARQGHGKINKVHK